MIHLNPDTIRSPRTIREVMSKYPIWVEYDQTLKETLDIMKKHKVSHLPVCSGLKVVGMISKSDLLERALEIATSSSGKTYAEKILKAVVNSDFMSLEPVVIRDHDSENLAKELMVNHMIHALPVLNDADEIQGIVTFYDLLK